MLDFPLHQNATLLVYRTPLVEHIVRIPGGRLHTWHPCPCALHSIKFNGCLLLHSPQRRTTRGGHHSGFDRIQLRLRAILISNTKGTRHLQTGVALIR